MSQSMDPNENARNALKLYLKQNEKLKIERICRKTGLTRPGIMAFLKGENGLRLSTAVKLADCLNTTLEKLVYGN